MADETVTGLRVTVTITGRVVGSDGAAQDVDVSYDRSFVDGTGANQAECWFYDASRAISQAGENVDLSGSASYPDFKGAALAMTGMSVFFLENLDPDTGDSVAITRPASNGVSGMQAASNVTTVQPGGLYLWIAPTEKATVTAGTADLINLAAADAAGSNVKLLIVGDNT